MLRRKVPGEALKMGKVQVVFALILSLTLAILPKAHGQKYSELENFLRSNLNAKELLHLTDLGYSRIIPARFLTEYWSAESFERLAQDANSPIEVDDGLSLHHALAHAGSNEAAGVYRKMKNYVSLLGAPHRLKRVDLIHLATRIYWQKITDSVSAYLPVVTGTNYLQIQSHAITKPRYERIFEQLNSGDIESIARNHLIEIAQIFGPMDERLLTVNLFLILKSIEYYADSESIEERALDQRIVHHRDPNGTIRYGVPSSNSEGELKIHWVSRTDSGVQVQTEFRDPSPTSIQLTRLKNLLRSRFNTAELFQFTAEGLSEILSPLYFLRPLTASDCKDIAQELLTVREVNVRSSAPLQIFHARSDHAGQTFRKLAAIMEAGRIERIQFSDLRRLASEVYSEMKSSENIAATFHIKAGAFHPVVNPQNMKTSTMERIETLFSEDFTIPVDDNVDRSDRQIGLSHRAIHELSALRLATRYFENEFEILREDMGGWEGNIPQFAIDIYNDYLGGTHRNSKRFVCTDEAMTTMFFVFHLMKKGLIREFEIVDFRFAHRFKERTLGGKWYKQPYSDHFGVLIRHKSTGNFYVIDTWVKNGGEPAHIMNVSDWNNHGENNDLDTVGVPRFLEGFDSYLDNAIHNRRVLRSETPSSAEELLNPNTPNPLKREKKNCEHSF